MERTLLDDYNIQLSYKTFQNYYETIVENNKDYNIKPLILEDLCRYIGQSSFNEFCEKNPIKRDEANIKVSVNGVKAAHETTSFSEIIINITNKFTLPEFVSKNSQSFGFLGILLLGGFLVNKAGYFSNKANIKKQDSTLIKKPENEGARTPQTFFYIPQNEKPEPQKIIVSERKKDCMFWNNDHYERVFCDEKTSGETVIALNEEKLALKKILMTDTLTPENSLGKVWYDKTNKRVDFFTHYGIHPENGKTLKPVTEHILETYCGK